MSAKDVEEGKPLLGHLNTKERTAIEEMEDVGEVPSPYATALQMSLRTGVWMSIMASCIWVPSIKKMILPDIASRIPLLICMFVFTVNPFLGGAVCNGCTAILGTFWACLHMWVMNGIFPGGMKEGMSPSSSTAIFGWCNFLVFTFVFLFTKCGMGMKMFALATDIGFMLAFLNPASTVPFSENFTISSKGTAVNTMISTFIGCCLIPPVLNLIPWPFTFASEAMKGNAVKASQDIAKLFHAVILYYNEREYSVVVETELKRSVDLRKELDGLGGPIGAAWFERFDIGTPGTIRGLMECHVGVMNNVYDRLRAVLVAVHGEDFGESHITIMNAIRESSIGLSLRVQKLLVAATEAATDGDISSQEKAQLQEMMDEVKKAIKCLAIDFDGARRQYGTVISKDTFGESFFVLNISAYARLVVEYADLLCTNPPKGVSFGEGISGGVTATFTNLTDKFNVNFTLKHYVALFVCWLWAVYVDNWGGGCVITAVFLMSTAVCPDIQVFLNVINAVVVSCVVGTLVYQTSCATGYGDFVLPICAVLIWFLGLYGFFSGGPLALPCLLVVALTPFRWVTECPKGEISAGARALWAGLVSNMMAIFFVCTCQFLMAIDRANNLAIEELDAAFNSERESFVALWAHKDITVPMAPAAGHLGTGEGYNGSAKIEPRLWRCPWKGGLYSEINGQLGQIRLDLLMLWFALAGSDGKPDSIFSKFEHAKEWKAVQSDLNGTFEDAHNLVIGLLKHESGNFKGLSMLKTTTGIDVLDDLPALIDDLAKSGEVNFPKEVGDTMEDDEVCQIATVFLLLDTTIKHIAGLLQTSIRQS